MENYKIISKELLVLGADSKLTHKLFFQVQLDNKPIANKDALGYWLKSNELALEQLEAYKKSFS